MSTYIYQEVYNEPMASDNLRFAVVVKEKILQTECVVCVTKFLTSVC